MDDKPRSRRHGPPTPPTHRRATSPTSSSSSSSPGLLSKFPFMKLTADRRAKQDDELDDEAAASAAPARSLATAVQQHKTRRRRGSLRKVALLGRGAQRDRRDSRSSSIGAAQPSTALSSESAPSTSASDDAGRDQPPDPLGLTLSDPPRRSPVGGFSSRLPLASLTVPSDTTGISHPEPEGEVPGAYTSTTDEDDVLQIPHGSSPSRPVLSKGLGSESYFSTRDTMERRRSFQQARSPLSYSGLTPTALPAPDSDWDYSETERWGWVVLCVTWFVFVIGMGSCLDVWSWAWDVGTTPYAPPVFEVDRTLPLVGYYPVLIILTGVMAWVWVLVAWTGMKYFRHAKISGD